MDSQRYIEKLNIPVLQIEWNYFYDLEDQSAYYIQL